MLDISIDRSSVNAINFCDIDAGFNPYTITYVSAPCSAGKTYALADHLKDELSRTPLDEPQQFMYVAPTVKLLEQFSSELTQRGITDVTLIASSDNANDVFGRLTQHLRRSELYHATHVTLITHESFLKLPTGLRNPKRWRIFMDEVPPIDCFQIGILPKTRDVLAHYLEATPFTEALVRIDKKRGENLSELLRDSGLAGLQQMLHKLDNPNYAIYTDAGSFGRVFNPSRSNCDPSFSLPLLALVKPDVFDGCCVLSANFEDSMLFDLLKRHKKCVATHSVSIGTQL